MTATTTTLEDNTVLPSGPSGTPAPHAHTLTAEQALTALGSHANGLTEAEARKRLDDVGPNALPEQEAQPSWRVFVRQFQSPLIYLLVLAAGLAFALGERTDAIVIITVVLVNAVIGAYQERRAERSMAALRRITSIQTRVLREGHERMINARELVPGDVVLLAAGDAVPADARLLESAGVEAAEAALTGESVPVAKNLEPQAENASLAERHNMLYAGTHLTAGRAKALVVATGVKAEVGKIAQLTESAEQDKTPLEKRIEQFGKYLLLAGAGVFVAVLAAGLARGMATVEILMVGVSQLVSVVPEGLPAAMTIALAVGMQRMAARGAIVRRLSAVESLGSTTVICTDKTGTLTRNEMTVTTVHLPDGRELGVRGIGYALEGKVFAGEREVSASDDAALRELCEAVALCNDAELKAASEGPVVLGDPTEVALLVLAEKAGVPVAELRARVPRSAEIPFDSRAKMMATQHGDFIIVKGAPEAVLELLAPGSSQEGKPLADSKSALELAQSMATKALRVLAVARVPAQGTLAPDDKFDKLRGRATLLGLIGQIDPPRDDVRAVIHKCSAAGIRTVMVTGDHKATGLAIARQIEIAKEDSLALDDKELERLQDAELTQKLDHVAVFARVQPSQKLRIVNAFKARGDVVAMTGDGVNDAPALARADVGVAMGITGTEAAKQAADIVITDDSFATIVRAVEEGRVVYRNLKKVILLLLSTGLAEVLVLVVAVALGYPLPFAAVQILWNNVITEGTITINLTMDPAEGTEMQRPPIPKNEPIITRAMLGRLSLMGVTIAVVTLGFFVLRLHSGVSEAFARTGTFTLLAVCEWFNVLNCRSETASALSLDVLRNRALLIGLVLSNLLQIAVVYTPALNETFYTVPLPLSEVLLIGATGSIVLWVEEARKLYVRSTMKRAALA
jgi:magnesium-transporting ATPase (P-type)